MSPEEDTRRIKTMYQLLIMNIMAIATDVGPPSDATDGVRRLLFHSSDPEIASLQCQAEAGAWCSE
jgi:hypothetical protein